MSVLFKKFALPQYVKRFHMVLCQFQYGFKGLLFLKICVILNQYSQDE
ncbi:hypothetical protein HMPREF9103_02141 [Lentilactobacillus parafarraginis F0439]|uniref:Uncharacterized protein n=1 Tax=Lentilactobacillus parafarraginis F0439 TaxID=797515 RepID=G9ZQY3_9LACO|nr:hypothetical protein HMPREF9103_02141 [Lentilactobacillus parafarraginis F0439]